MRKHWQVVIGIGMVLCAMGAGWKCHKMHPGCLPGLPCNDYVYGNISPAVSVFSLDAVPFDSRQPYGPGVPAGSPIRDRVKVFQLSQPQIQNDHCFLRRVALTLEENGEWTLSLRADQNPWMTGPLREVSNPTPVPGAVSALKSPEPNLGKETDGLKRNQFFVKVRCYANYPKPVSQAEAVSGKAVLVELPTAMFWVQRGYPYDFWARQSLPGVSRYFDLIDRVEVEFSYR